jgi:hypothetical protein
VKRFLVLVAAGVLLTAAGSSSRSTVTEVQVNKSLESPFPQNKQNEPALAQNPRNPLNLISASNDEVGESACMGPVSNPPCGFTPGVSVSGFYASQDGGLTWPCQGIVDLEAEGEYGFGDPGVAFDSRGNAYYSMLAHPVVGPDDQIDLFVAKSTDGGCTYPSASKVNVDGQPADKPAIAVDTHPKSRFRDRIYVAWTESPRGAPDRIVFARSLDGGLTWGQSTTLSTPPRGPSGVIAASLAVAPDGTVYVAWLNERGIHATERLAVSRDGGSTFAIRDAPIVSLASDTGGARPGASFRQQPAFPVLAVAKDGTVYMGFGDARPAQTAVFVTRSRDGGRHWTKPVSAGSVPGRNVFFSTLAVEPSGRVDVAFLALDVRPAGTAPGPGVVHYDAYFARSVNRGMTWSAPQKLSSASSDPDGSTANNLTMQFVGDYINAVADSRGGRLYVVWTDARNAASCPAVDAFRSRSDAAPDVSATCPPTFGNTDIYLATVTA